MATACPVCKFNGIDNESEKCPQCNADLTCFKILDSFPDIMQIKPEPITAKRVPGFETRLFLLALVLICLILLVSILNINRIKRVETRLDGIYKGQVAMKKTIAGNIPKEKLLEHINNSVKRFLVIQTQNLQQKTDASLLTKSDGKKLLEDIRSEFEKQTREISKKFVIKTANNQVKKEIFPKPEFWIYQANKQDTLWDIAKKYYGRGFYFPVLLEHNQSLSLYKIGRGVSIKILVNPLFADKIYKKVVKKKGGNIYWYYTVVKGDTRKSITTRFYKTKDNAGLIDELNPDINSNVKMQPGTRLKIKL